MPFARNPPESLPPARTLRPGDGVYPVRLDRLPDRPAELRVRGELRDGPAVALVGSRRPDGYGLEMARELGAGLARAGVTVVSGGAMGVDGEAHRGAIEAGGHTVVVLGNGLARPHPTCHAPLFRSVLDAGGALLSEHPDDTPGFPANFPARNRIIAALSRAVVVVRAGEGSGALITAERALGLGVPVLAVPGDVRDELSAGAVSLFRRGAGVACAASDVLRAIGLEAPPERQLELPCLGGDEGKLLGALGRKPRHVDELARAVGVSPGSALAGLLELELRGLCEQRPGHLFLRRA